MHTSFQQGVDEKKSWDSVGWDVIAERDPDLIVLVDASWDLARESNTSVSGLILDS